MKKGGKDDCIRGCQVGILIVIWRHINGTPTPTLSPEPDEVTLAGSGWAVGETAGFKQTHNTDCPGSDRISLR